MLNIITFHIKTLLVFVGFFAFSVLGSYPSAAPEEVWQGNWLWMSPDFESQATYTFDGDKLADVFVAASDGAYWYENDGNDNGLRLVTKIQDGPIEGYGSNAVDVGFLDSDDRMDLLIGEENPGSFSAPVRWYESNLMNDSFNIIYTCASNEFASRPAGHNASKCGIAFGVLNDNEYGNYVLCRSGGQVSKFESQSANTVAEISSAFISTGRCVEFSDMGLVGGIKKYLFVGRSTTNEILMYLTDTGNVHYQGKLELPNSQKAVSMALGDFNQADNYNLFVATDTGNLLQYTMSRRWWDGNPIATLDAQIMTGGALCVGLGDIDSDGVVELLVGTSTGIDFYEPNYLGIATYRSTKTLGVAVNDLAIAAYQCKSVPIGWINTLEWTLRPNNEGFWEKPMANYILGMMISNTGLKEAYWDVYNYGYALYPSQNYPDKVYNNYKSGYEFSSVDMPSLAIDVAAMNDVSIKLSIWWDSGCEGIVSELLDRYPQAEFVIFCNGTSPTEIETSTSGVDMSRVAIRANLGRNTVDLSKQAFETLRNAYTYDGDVLFHRQINVQNSTDSCQIALAAERKFQLFVNGQLVASDQRWDSDELFEIHIYDVSEYVHIGVNDFVVAVESTDLAGGLLVNIKIGDEVFGSDKNWRVRAINAPLTENQVSAYCSDNSGWSEPLVESGSNVWPVPRRMMGPVIWQQWSPLPATEVYATYLFGINTENNIDIYGGGKLNSITGMRDYSIEYINTVIGQYGYYEIAIGDLDGNGLLDVVCVPAGITGNNLWGYLEQDTDAEYCPVFRYQMDEGGNLVYKGPIEGVLAKPGRTKLVIGDFDGDSYDDLFVVIQGNPDVYGNHQSSTAWYECYSVMPFAMRKIGNNITNSWSSAVAVGNLDNAGGNDILVACDTSGLLWYRCSGSDMMALAGTNYNSHMKNIIDIVMGDLDGDGITDVITIRNPGLLPTSDPHKIDANGVLEWRKMVFPATSLNNLVTVGVVDWEFDFVSCDIGDVDGDGRKEIIATKSDGTVKFFSPIRNSWDGSNDMLGGKPLGHLSPTGYLQDVTNLIRISLYSSDVIPCDIGINIADLNSDCKVDFLDFALLATSWLTSAYQDNSYRERPIGDINYDTFVDIYDLELFAEQWRN